MAHYFFTSESVTEGHPDKLCDRISDAILDEYLKGDPDSHVACEVTACPGLIHIMGEISSKVSVNVEQVAREEISEVGYNALEYGFDSNTCAILSSLTSQSPDIARGVNKSSEYREDKSDSLDKTGAGDQGIMFGFACDETPEYMPLPIFYAHKLAERLSDVRKNGLLEYLRPDGKTQVTVEYDENDVPVRIETILISAQHSEEIGMSSLRSDLVRYVINPIIPDMLMDEDTKILVNPTGRFVLGGPAADTGLTGRKIIVDTYGGYSRHGGGAFSGKDPTKVDRSAAYAARYVAKNIVAAGLAKKCEIQLSYAIGVAKPISVLVETFGTGRVSDDKLAEAVDHVFDLRPAAIIKELHLKKPDYKKLSSYGHFGRPDTAWEQLDKTEALLAYINS